MSRRKKAKTDLGVPSQEHTLIQNSWISFDHFWCTAKHTYKLSENMKIALKTFFEKKGFMETDKFNEGLKAFGIKEIT